MWVDPPGSRRTSSCRTSWHRSARRRESTPRPSHRSCGKWRGVSRLHHRCDRELPWLPVLLQSFHQHWKCNLHEMWEERDGGPKFGLSSVWKVWAIKGFVTLNITKVKRILEFLAIVKLSLKLLIIFCDQICIENIHISQPPYSGQSFMIHNWISRVFTVDRVRHRDQWWDLLLVVENDVRPPDVVSRDVETLDSAVLLGIPHELVIPPELLNPQIGCHNLVLQVLKIGRKERRWLSPRSITPNFDKLF